MTTELANAQYAYAESLALAEKTRTFGYAQTVENYETQRWNAAQIVVNAWQTATNSVKGDCVAAVFSQARSESLDELANYVSQLRSEANARETAKLTQALADSAYLLNVANANDVAAENIIDEHLTLLQIEAEETQKLARKKADLIYEKMSEQLDDIYSCRQAELDDYADRVRSSSVSIEWISFETQRLALEAALFQSLTVKAQELETECQTELRSSVTVCASAQRDYSKNIADVEAEREREIADAEYDWQTVVNAAEKSYSLTVCASEESEDDESSEPSTASLEVLSILRTAFDDYYDTLSVSCNATSNTALRSFYTSIVAAYKTAFDSYNDAAATLENGVLTRTNAFENSVESITRNYYTSIIAATEVYNTNVVEKRRTTAYAEIAAEQAYRYASAEAEFALTVAAAEAEYDYAISVSEATSDAALRLVTLSQVCGTYWLHQTNTGFSGDPKYAVPFNMAFLWSEFTVFPKLAESPQTVIEMLKHDPEGTGSVGQNPILRHISFTPLPSQTPRPSGYWSQWLGASNSILSTEIKAAELRYNAALDEAWQTYVGVFTGTPGAPSTGDSVASSAGEPDASPAFEPTTGIYTTLVNELTSLKRQEQENKLAADAVFTNAELAAENIALERYNAAYRAQYLDVFVSNYEWSAARADATFDLNIASAFGAWQLATRRELFRSVSTTNPLYGAFDADVSWATQTNRLRYQYYSSLRTASTNYHSTVRSASNLLHTNIFADGIAYSRTSSAAYRTRVRDLVSINANATRALFDAESTRISTQIGADSAERYSDAKIQAELSRQRSDDFDAAFEELKDEFDADFVIPNAILSLPESTLSEDERNAYFSNLDSSFNTFTSILADIPGVLADLADIDVDFCTAAYGFVPETQTFDDEPTYSQETTLGRALANNLQTYDEAIARSESVFKESRRLAYKDMTIDSLAAFATEATSLSVAAQTLKASLSGHYNDWLTTISVAGAQFEDASLRYAEIYSYHQERIDLLGATVSTSGIFTNTTFDYEVCFVAGTPVLMADGSTKPIEALEPGDLVLAANHLAPEESPSSAKVVRFFDNGEKTVVCLRFAGQELVCTPDHPFYVVNKGWTPAAELVSGDLCLSAKGESAAFVSREELSEKQRVYNFEVEDAHTYFVGGGDGVLAHNACAECGQNGEHICFKETMVYYHDGEKTTVFLGQTMNNYHEVTLPKDIAPNSRCYVFRPKNQSDSEKRFEVGEKLNPEDVYAVRVSKLADEVDDFLTPNTDKKWQKWFKNNRDKIYGASTVADMLRLETGINLANGISESAIGDLVVSYVGQSFGSIPVLVYYAQKGEVKKVISTGADASLDHVAPHSWKSFKFFRQFFSHDDHNEEAEEE